MKFIASASALDINFRKLLLRYKKISFAVAWATYEFPSHTELLKCRKKIIKGIVGTHFYQTHPAFIEEFLNDKRVRFVKETAGIFHPKFYLFENSAADWSCLLGSANFTKGAFTANSEACLVVDSDDDPSGTIRNGLDRAIKKYWTKSDYFDVDDLTNYKNLRRRFLQHHKAMSGTFGEKKPTKPALSVPLLTMSWKKYLQQVQKNKKQRIDERIKVLESARGYFEKYKRFNKMPGDVRKRIAGFGSDPNVEWGWFGSMFGAGTFKKLVNANHPNLSKALDAIPASGEVKRDHYLDFIHAYRSAFPGDKRHGLATATRLLALKRPDYFVCFDSANRAGLCKAFGVPISNHDYKRYWDSVIERIFLSEWWNAPRPALPKDARLWDGRAALLDALYYSPN